MQSSTKKLTVILFACAGLAALFILAAGLPGIRFHDSLPLPGIKNPSPPEGGPIFPGSELFVLIIFWITVIALPLALIVILMSPEGRKRLITQLMQLGLLLLVVFLAASARAPFLEDLKGIVAAASGSGGSERASSPPQSSPEWLTWLLSIAVAAMLVTAGYQAWQRWKNRSRPVEISEDLGASAAQALTALREGREFKEAILRCYQQMMNIAAAERALARPDFLTPAEFIAVLKDAGLPHEAVEQLTHLFEFARYSTHPATPQQNAQAVTCLEAIVQACQAPA